MPFDRRLLAPLHWPAWLGVAVLVLYGNLPAAFGRRIGRTLGALMRRLAGERVHIARRNIELCFPDWSADQRQDLLQQNFLALGEGSYEFARAWWGSTARWERGLKIDGIEVLRALQAEGRGVLMLSGHFFTLDICGRLLCSQIPAAAMYRRHRNPVLEWAIRRGRLRYASAMFARDQLRPAVRFLKQGGILWYAPDQDMLGQDSVFAPFFGIPAATITATHQLQRLTGAAVVPFFHRRDGTGAYRLRLGPPLPDLAGESAADSCARINAQIEQMVREAPAEYLWVHRRFKTRPDGQTALYR
ncbi:MAG: LpxL/LpxP family Kdo(2)-lipid IV(A) lauroyl/palmitoleoyl acyltransferase [Lysobacterales bacterium]